MPLCAVCATPLTAGYADQVYCGPACRREARNRRRRHAPVAVMATCQHAPCGRSKPSGCRYPLDQPASRAHTLPLLVRVGRHR